MTADLFGARLCVSKEFRCFAANAERPITKYLRAVATDLAAGTPGRGVGVIGMYLPRTDGLPGNPDGYGRKAHSLLTRELRENRRTRRTTRG
jgi:hypothetical protein